MEYRVYYILQSFAGYNADNTPGAKPSVHFDTI